ncbi:hypothetical protein GGR57DRAFT_488042 [Xylariaceae sp. FL1272]|nr:hypothetical protein GGR57DRAFT_488042 [Xylariaceae sp. FL1272]
MKMHLLQVISAFGVALTSAAAALVPTFSPMSTMKRGSDSAHCTDPISELVGKDFWIKRTCDSIVGPGAKVHLALNLNHCLVNSNGELHTQLDGNFAHSCTDIHLNNDGKGVKADCGNGVKTIEFGDVIRINGEEDVGCFNSQPCWSYSLEHVPSEGDCPSLAATDWPKV